MKNFEVKDPAELIHTITGWSSLDEFKTWQAENYEEFKLPEQKMCMETLEEFKLPSNKEQSGAIRAGVRAYKENGQLIRQGIFFYYKGNEITRWCVTPSILEPKE